MEYVDFASRDSASAVYISGLQRARAREILEQIQTRTAGPALSSIIYEKHSQTSSCIMVLASRFAAARTIEAWDGTICFGRRISVRPAADGRRVRTVTGSSDAASWRDIHRLPLLSAHQCTLVCNACLGVTAWSSCVSAVTAVLASQISDTAPRFALSQQEESCGCMDDTATSLAGFSRFAAEAALKPPPASGDCLEMSGEGQSPQSAQDTGPEHLDHLQSASGSFFRPPLARVSTGCIEQAAPSTRPVLPTPPHMCSPPAGSIFKDTTATVFDGDVPLQGAAWGAQQAAASGLDFSGCTWTSDPPLDTSASSGSDPAPHNGSDGITDIRDNVSDGSFDADICGELQGEDDAGFVPDLHSGLLLADACVPGKPEHIQEHDIGWSLDQDACLHDGSAVHDNGPLAAAIEGGVDENEGEEADPVAAYTACVQLHFHDTRVVVSGHGAFGRLSDEAAAARAAESAAKRAREAHKGRSDSAVVQAAARDAVLADHVQRWHNEGPLRRLARWRRGAVDAAMQAAFRQVRLAVHNGGPLHGGRTYVLVQGPEAATTGLVDAAGGSKGGLFLSSPLEAQRVIEQSWEM